MDKDKLIQFFTKPDKCPGCGHKLNPENFQLTKDSTLWEDEDDGVVLPSLYWNCSECMLELCLDVEVCNIAISRTTVLDVVEDMGNVPGPITWGTK